MTIKLTFKVKEFRAHLLPEGSHYDGTEVNEKTVQIALFLFELSAILYFSWWMTMKKTFMVNELHGHLSPPMKAHM
jgi:hypothetical protein